MRHNVIVMVGTGLDTRGGVSAVVRVYERQGLLQQGQVHYIATHGDGSKWRKLGLALKGALSYWGLLARGRVDLLHVHSSSGASFWRKCLFILPTLALRKPVVLHWHGGRFVPFFARCGAVRRALIRAVFRRSSRVVALSQQWQQILSEHCPGSRVVCLPNPVDVPAQQASLQHEPLTALFLGVINTDKGIHELLQAWQRVHAVLPRARLRIGGLGAVRQAQAKAAQLGLGDSVEWLGWVGGADKALALEQAALLVLPSHMEAMPMSVLEAMAAGVPVVATDVGGIPLAVRHGTDGLLVPAKQVEPLADALLQLLQDAALRQRMGQCARERVQASFAAEVIVPQLRALWAEVLRGAAMPPAAQNPVSSPRAG